MAKTQAFEPETQYRVVLAKPVEIAPGRVLRPRNEHILKGKLLSRIIKDEGADCVATAERR